MSQVGCRERAEKAGKKRAAFGPDVDPGAYSAGAPDHGRIRDLGELPAETRERAREVGMEADETCRAGSFFQMDHSVILSSSQRSGLEVMDINEARQRYDWLSGYWWRAVAVDADKYTAEAELNQNRGYFLRALPGARAEFPLQACLFMSEEGLAQNVHNVIIAEEGSELHIITGCATAASVRSGLHVGVSEFYVKRGARLTFTMIHSWAEDMVVRPRSAAVVEEEGVFLSNYVCMKPVRSLQMFPTVTCAGENATVRFNNILYAPAGSEMDVGSQVLLKARGSRAEVVSRAITAGGSIIARGRLVGEVPEVKAHLECRGLILADEGRIHAVPELEGRVKNVDMSHEAAVGKIAEEEIEYLMARGLTGDEATAAIVRGFLDVEITGLPPGLEQEMKRAVRFGEEEHAL
jgi:Fe-S cluster assembly scaffold protein SufB